MTLLPQHLSIVRNGRLQVVEVADFDAMVDLRTELELVTGFARAAGPDARDVLRRRRAAIRQGDVTCDDASRADLDDMIQILSDATDAINVRTIRQIDALFPEARGELNMDSIDKESQQFADDVAAQREDLDFSALDELCGPAEEANYDSDPVDAALTEAASLLDSLDAEPQALEENQADDSSADITPEEVSALLAEPASEESLESDPETELIEQVETVAEGLDELADGVEAVEESLDETLDAVEALTGAAETGEEEEVDSAAGQAFDEQASAALANAESIRQRIQEVRASLNADVQDALSLMSEIDALREQAEAELHRAAEFKRAAQAVQDANREVCEAQKIVDEARSTFESAQAQLEAARRSWESAQASASKFA